MASDDSWRAQAACRGQDVETFYSLEESDVRYALSLCGECPVRRRCYEYAVAQGEMFGIWGGTAETERRALLQERENPSAA